MGTRKEKLIEPTIPSEFVFDALQTCLHRGTDVDQLLSNAGLDPVQVNVKGSRVSVVDYARLIEMIILKFDDGFLGFLDDHIPIKAFSVFSTQLAACDNIEQMLIQANRFFALFTDQFHLEIRLEGDNAAIVLHFNETREFDYRFIYQSILLVIIRLIQWFVGETIRPGLVQFTFEQTHLDKHLNYLFGSPLVYSQAHNEIHIGRALLKMPCSTNLEQVQMMLRDSRRLMLVSHRAAPFTRRVRKELVLNREDGWLSIEEIANRMNLSKNLLWRKLKKESTTFLDIRDSVKRDLAISLINKSDLTISDIAAKVGFADVSAFNKAFTKWTRQSPSAYRNQLTSP